MINITTINPIIGIYKITSPSGKIYIGQSVNILKRWKNYKWLHNSAVGSYLLRSLKKYGVDQHKFEVIEECSIEQLNERETYYKQIELDKVNGDWSKVLFYELYDNGGGPRSEQIKEKISKATKGKLKHTDESKQKLSQFQKGRPKPEGYSEKIRQLHLGKTRSEETKKRMSECRKGIPNLKNKKPKPPGFGKHISKAVHQISLIDNSIIATYPSLKVASEITGVKPQNISRCCTGRSATANKYKWVFA